MEIVINVSNFIFFRKSPLERLDRRILPLLRATFIYSNPKYFRDQRMGVYNRKKYLKTFFETDERFFVTRGENLKLLEVLKEFNVSYILNDIRYPGRPIDFSLTNLESREYQKNAVDIITQKSQYLLSAPCGSGKTTMALMLIEKLKTTTLVIVPLTELLVQWTQVLKTRGIYDFEIGQIYQEEKTIKPITIALFQSLHRFNQKQWDNLNNYFGAIIIDECHRIPAQSVYATVNSSKAKYRYGVSATLERGDQTEFLLFSSISYRRHSITDDDLREAGVYIKTDVEFLKNHTPVQTKPPKAPDEYSMGRTHQLQLRSFYRELIDELLSNPVRNDLILKNVLTKADTGHSILILSPRVEWINKFTSRLKREGANVNLITGKVPKETRKEILESFRQTKTQIIVATDKIASEGLDLPNLSNIHLVIPPSGLLRLKQMCGRAQRKCEGKKTPVISDYVDTNSFYLRNIYKKRLSWYKRSKFNIINAL